MSNLVSVLILTIVVALVIWRLPRIDVGHSRAFRVRRLMNWLPLGLTYAFLYMGRYNLTVSKNALGGLMTKEDFGTIFFWGTLTYGCAFVINGPLTDRIGGRKAILIAAGGAAVMNALLGLVTEDLVMGGGPASSLLEGITGGPVGSLSLIYAANMYFQSFGAVSIVKVNASWFHLRERGVFGAIFGILISLGIYFAFDVGRLIVEAAPMVDPARELRAMWWVFWIPAALLAVCFVAVWLMVRDTPGEAGHTDFDTADASSGDTGPRLGLFDILAKMLSDPVIRVIMVVEFCSGFLRNAIMHWYIIFAKQTGVMDTFVPQNWGVLLFAAGVLGGTFAGTISDHVFQSRRGPVAAILYGGMVLGGAAVLGLLTTPAVGWVVVLMSLCIIGVHGMLSGTASMDFGGRRNVGVAVGLIDGCVYLGTAAQSFLLGSILPEGEAAADPGAWTAWPGAMLPVAIIGLAFAARVWNAKPKSRAEPQPAPAPAAAAIPVDAGAEER